MQTANCPLLLITSIRLEPLPSEVKMIKTTSEKLSYQTSFSNGHAVSLSDTTDDKGGSSAGFSPHELLEAALASCMNMSIRMFAKRYSIPLTSVSTTVTINMSNPDETIFCYTLDLIGSLSENERQHLTKAAQYCPVRQTLFKTLSFSDQSGG